MQIRIGVNAYLRSKMAKNILDLLYDENRNLPNQFTEALGKLIREARIEAKMSQKELAEKAYLRQSSVSRIELGTRAVSTEDLLYLSDALEKPVSYFFPKKYANEIEENNISGLEYDLLVQVRQLSQSDVKKLIAQARALVELNNDDEPEPKKSPKHQEEFKKLVEQATKKKEKLSR